MKRILFAILLITFCVTLFASCSKAPNNFSSTDPDSLPKSYSFSGSFAISPSDNEAEIKDCSDETILSILNSGLWERAVISSEHDYIFTVNDTELWYDSSNGIFANCSENRQLTLNDADKSKINDLLKTMFPSNQEEIDEVIILTYCGNKENAITISDKQEYSLLLELILKASGEQGESTKGNYGVPYGLTVYIKGKAKPLEFSLWSKTQYSTSKHKDNEGYEYFFNDDLTDLYEYLDNNYPSSFWYGE